VSAIFQRVVQAESWLVNGPDALRGITPPLTGLFPLGGRSVAGAIAIALIGGSIWAVTTWALGRTREMDGRDDLEPASGTENARADGSGDTGPRAPLAKRLHAVATLGTDRLLGDPDASDPDADASAGAGASGGRSRARSIVDGLGRDRYVGSALLAGVVAGVVGGVMAFVAPVGLLVWGTVVSVFTWLVLLVGLDRYAAGFDWVDHAATLALGAGYMLALAPMYYLDAILLWVPLTLLAFGVVIGATVYLRANWSRFASQPFRYSTFAGFWFGIIWYFPIQILAPLATGELMTVATRLFNNVVWVLSFSGAEPVVGYTRFQLFLFGSIVFLSVYATELIVDSPFGRVLRAVRNDERVVNSLGKDPFIYKVQSMAIGSALAGLAGALAALYFQTLVFTMFAPRVTFIALLMMFLGGVGNNRAMVAGAFLFWAFQTATTQLSGFVAPGLREHIQAFRFVVMGVLFLALLYYRPEGLLGERSRAGRGE
jgi:ABC-type branched-subunit amino acid transport system permease subunit